MMLSALWVLSENEPVVVIDVLGFIGNNCLGTEEGKYWYRNADGEHWTDLQRSLLMKVFPEAELHIIPDAGHSSREPGIAKKLVEVKICLNDN